MQCFVCPSHAIDGFIKNALSDTGTIRIQANAMSHVEFATIPWGETMFKNTYEKRTRRSLHAAKYEQVAAELGENVHATCHG